MSARNGVNYACLLVAKPLLQRRPSPPPASGVVGAGNVGTSDCGPGPSGSCCGLRCGYLQVALQLCTADVLRNYSVRVELCCSILLGIIPYTVHTLSEQKVEQQMRAFRFPLSRSSLFGGRGMLFSNASFCGPPCGPQPRRARCPGAPISLDPAPDCVAARACSVH